MTDIGNIDAKEVILAPFFGINGIVKVLGINAIDGDDWPFAPVKTPFKILFRDDLRDKLGGFLDFFGKIKGQVLILDDGDDINAHIALFAKDFRNGSFCFLTSVGPDRNLDDNLVPVAGIQEVLAPHIDILSNMAVIRGNKAKIPTARKSPDTTFMGPLQNTDDLSLTPSPIAMVTDPCDYKVLVHRTG